jgi:outer membrane protein OmpA-like peptidoglycan-associated protein
MENNNRPVFESFNEFVQFVYGEAINEAVKIDSLSDLQTMLGSMGMDNNGKKALTEVESLAAQSGLSFTAADLSQLSTVLSKLNIPDVTKVDSVDVAVETFVYDNLRGGAVKTQKGEKIGLAQFLSTANKRNLKPISVSKTPQVDKDKKRFDLNEEGDFQAGAGLIGNYLPVQAEGTLDLKKYTFADPVKNSIISFPFYDKTPAKKELKDTEDYKKNLHVVYALYYPISIKDGGQEYSSKEVETYVRPKAVTTEKLKPIVVQEDLPLFKVNTAELTEDGKLAITQALSNVTTAKSISIRGGASQEGTPERNKELCKLRAEAVAEFLKPTFPGTAITADPEGDIQPLKPETDEKTRKTFRKITMNVDGTTLVKQSVKEDETVTMINTVKKAAQKVNIGVAYITINSQIIA